MTKLLTILFLAILIGKCNAATNIAASCSWVDVSNAVSLCSDGDTAVIPSGAAMWTNKLTIAKSINLFGQTNNTVISFCDNQILRWSGVSSNAGFRMNGICFSNIATGFTNYSPVEVDGPLLTFRIDHCVFIDGYAPLFLIGQTEGLIDHVAFTNCQEGILLVGDEANSWLRPIVPGTTNCTVIEDNWFHLDDVFTNFAASHNQDIYHQGGARSTTRYNTWDHNSFHGSDSFWDSHGEQSSGTIKAQPLCEMYMNTINATNSASWQDGMDTRGGTCLIWSNTWTLSKGTNYVIYVVHLIEEGTPNKPYYGGNPVTNTFIWANIAFNLPVTQAYVSIDSPKTNGTIALNQNWWMEAPNTTNGIAAGIYNGYTPLVYPDPLQNQPPTPQPGSGSSVYMPFRTQ